MVWESKKGQRFNYLSAAASIHRLGLHLYLWEQTLDLDHPQSQKCVETLVTLELLLQTLICTSGGRNY